MGRVEEALGSVRKRVASRKAKSSTLFSVGCAHICDPWGNYLACFWLGVPVCSWG